MADFTIGDLLYVDLSDGRVGVLTPAYLYSQRAKIARLTGIVLEKEPDQALLREIEVQLALKGQETDEDGNPTEEAREAINFLIEGYARLLAQRAFNHYHHTRVGDIGDYFGEAVLAAEKALKRFKPVKKKDGTYVSPLALVEQYVRHSLSHAAVEYSTGVPYSTARTLQNKGINPQKDILPLPDSDPDEDTFQWYDEEDAMTKKRILLRHKIDKALQHLDAKERAYVVAFFGLGGDPMPIQAIANAYLVPMSTVEVVLAKAIQKLKGALGEEVLALLNDAS